MWVWSANLAVGFLKLVGEVENLTSRVRRVLQEKGGGAVMALSQLPEAHAASVRTYCEKWGRRQRADPVLVPQQLKQLLVER